MAGNDRDTAWHREILRGAVWIQKKGVGIIQLKPNPMQAQFYARHLADIKAGRPTLEINMKIRQPGFTTGMMGLTMAKARTLQRHKALVTCHRKPTLQDVWDMYRLANTNWGRQSVEEDWDAEVGGGRKRGRQNDQFLQMPKTGTQIGIEIAGADLGRGGAKTITHMSEVDYWPVFWDPYYSLEPSLSMEPGACHVMETTLEDRPASEFRQFIDKSMLPHDDPDWTGWRVNFTSWLQVPVYTVPCTPAQRKTILETLDEEELDLVQTQKATADQLAWRREKIRRYGGNVKRFKQTYPKDALEALDSKSGTYYAKEALKFYREHARPPEFVRYAGMSPTGMYFRTSPHPDDLDAAPLECWEPPADGARYSMGVDAADEDQRIHAGSDCALSIIDRSNGAKVAQWIGPSNAHHFAKLCNAAGRAYENALMVIEKNQAGLAVISHLKDVHHYPNLWARAEKIDRYDGTITQQVIGFETRGNSRGPLFARHQEMVNDLKLKNLCERTVLQYRAFSGRDGKSQKHQSQGGIKDDMVVADALAVWGCDPDYKKWEPLEIAHSDQMLDAAAEESVQESSFDSPAGIQAWQEQREKDQWYASGGR